MSRPSRKRRPATPDVLQPGSLKERQLRAQIALLEREVSESLAVLEPADRRFVDRLIRTLAALHEAGDPLRSSPIEAQMAYRHPDSSVDEGSSTRWARSLAYRIRNDTERLLTEADQKLAGTWRDPETVPKVRCGNRNCSAYDINQSAWRTVRGGKTIPSSVCTACGTPYPATVSAFNGNQ